MMPHQPVENPHRFPVPPPAPRMADRKKEFVKKIALVVMPLFLAMAINSTIFDPTAITWGNYLLRIAVTAAVIESLWLKIFP